MVHSRAWPRRVAREWGKTFTLFEPFVLFCGKGLRTATKERKVHKEAKKSTLTSHQVSRGASKCEGTAVLRSVAGSGAGDGNRTHVCSLEGCRSTIELHPQRSRV